MIGRTLGQYQVVAKLGEGGMGEVYRARDTRLGREAAIKLLPAPMRSDASAAARFEREARAVAALNHPNIVTIYAIDEADGQLFIAMELVEGIATAARALPPALERVVRHCLEKKPDERFQSARDLAFALDALSSSSAASTSTVTGLTADPVPARRRRWLPAALVGLGVAGGLVIAAMATPADQTEVYRYTRFASEADAESMPAWSPDGRMIAFVRLVDNQPQIFVQSLDLETPRQLTDGAQGGIRPFWWPDSLQVGYIRRDLGIWAVQVVGGSPRQLYEGTFHDATVAAGGTMAAWRVTTTDGATTATVVVAPSPGAPFVEYAPAPFKMDINYSTNAVTFAPDGSSLILSMWDANVRPALWRLPMPAGSSEPERVPLTHVPLDRPAKASWLPDSRRFIVAAQPTGVAETQLWMIDASDDVAVQEMSARLSTVLPRACSGDMYAAVPRITPIAVRAGDVTVSDST